MRNGVQIKKLFDNPNYNFDYQFQMDIEPTKVFPVCLIISFYFKKIMNYFLKGDAFITSCKFSSLGRKKFTTVIK